MKEDKKRYPEYEQFCTKQEAEVGNRISKQKGVRNKSMKQNEIVPETIVLSITRVFEFYRAMETERKREESFIVKL